MAERWLTVIGPWVSVVEDDGPVQKSRLWEDFAGLLQVRDVTGLPGNVLLDDPNTNLWWVRCDETLVPTIEAHADYTVVTDDPKREEVV